MSGAAGHDALRLKRATRLLIAANGGLDGASATVGKTKSTAGRWQDVHDAAFISVADAAALEETAVRTEGWPQITREMARRQGFVLLALPEAMPVAGNLLGFVAVQAKESGDIANAVCSALADGRVTASEAGLVRREIADLLAHLAGMDAALALIEEGGQ